MIEAHQMGKDSKGQPIIGIFDDDVLIERLTVERIAGMYMELVALNYIAANEKVDEQEAE